MVGLGGGSIAKFVHERLPRTRITVDRAQPEGARRGAQLLRPPGGRPPAPGDSRRRRGACAGAPRRLRRVLLDAFDDGRSVRSLATTGFYAACRDALRPDGVFGVNFIADEPRLGTYLARSSARSTAASCACRRRTASTPSCSAFAAGRPRSRSRRSSACARARAAARAAVRPVRPRPRRAQPRRRHAAHFQGTGLIG